MQNTRNIKNILKTTNDNYLILQKYQGSYPKYLILNKYLKLLKKKGKYNGLVQNKGKWVSAGKRRVFVISTPFLCGVSGSSATGFGILA